MKSRFVKIVLPHVMLVLFINYVIGCSSSQTVTMEEGQKQNKVSEIQLTTGKGIKFDNSSGRFKYINNVLIGRTDENLWIACPLNSISEIHTSKPDTISRENLGNQKIFSIVVNEGILVPFDSNGGRFDPVKKSIIDNTTGGLRIRFHISRVKQIRLSDVERVSVQDIMNTVDSVTEVVTSDKHLISFADPGAVFCENKLVVEGTISIDGELHVGCIIPADQIKEIKMSEFSFPLTIVCVLVVFMVVVVVFSASYNPHYNFGGTGAY